MGIFRPDSRHKADEGLLLWKVRLFIVGAALGVGGMVTENPWVLWSGVGVLMVGMTLRFFGGRTKREDTEEPHGDDS
ncbi:MAG: hypothetical protein ACR2QM_09070 [Longimicrobiales bacterium]